MTKRQSLLLLACFVGAGVAIGSMAAPVPQAKAGASLQSVAKWQLENGSKVRLYQLDGVGRCIVVNDNGIDCEWSR